MGPPTVFLAILKAEGLNRAANAKDREINRVLQREELKWYSEDWQWYCRQVTRLNQRHFVEQTLKYVDFPSPVRALLIDGIQAKYRPTGWKDGEDRLLPYRRRLRVPGYVKHGARADAQRRQVGLKLVRDLLGAQILPR